METLSYLPLKKIFDNIDYDSLMNLLKTPMLRNITLEFYSDPINFRKLEKKIILDCIREFETSLQTNMFYELMDFFKDRGYVEVFDLPEYKKISDLYYDELLNLDIYEGSKISREKVLELREQDADPVEVAWLALKDYEGEEVDGILEKFEKKYTNLEDNHNRKFLKSFFQGPNSYQNVKDYLNAVNKYIQKYLQGNKYQTRITNFQNCIKRINKLKYIFKQ